MSQLKMTKMFQRKKSRTAGQKIVSDTLVWWKLIPPLLRQYFYGDYSVFKTIVPSCS